MSIVAEAMRSGVDHPAIPWAFRLLGGVDAGTLSCGFLTKRRGWDSRQSRRPSFSAVACLEGAARYSDASGQHEVRPGQLFFRFAGRPHSLEITAVPWRECWISLGEPIERLLIAAGLITYVEPVRAGTMTPAWLDEMAGEVDALRSAGEADLPLHLVRLQGLLLHLLVPPLRGGLDLARATALLADPRQTLADVARACGLPYDRFRREFRQRTGQAPGAYRQRRLLERARMELLASGRPIHAIAADLGYANPFAFSAAFRRGTGVSPRAWRRGG